MGPSEMAAFDRLWAPWRTRFLSRPKGGRCIFCLAKRSKDDRRHYVIDRGAEVFALLNLYPYNNGHVMIAPYRHVGMLERLKAEEWADMLRLIQRLMGRLKSRLHAQGFNVGLNLGRAAWAGILGHLHLHVVPRWNGDTYFLPVLGHTKVIPQSLDEVQKLLTRRTAAPS